MKRLVLISALLISVSTSALAWSGAGHMVIAGIAYKELSAETKLKVNALLKSHPDYRKWTNAFSGESAGMDLETFVFLRSSTWPDDIRRKHSDYDHPQWHYIDYPLHPKKFKMEEPAEHDNDILFGLNQSEKIITDAHASAESRAAHLSWVVHLVGDIHQPLHCASLFSAEFPKGDKGGNSFYVKPATRGIKLHSLWDGLLGTKNEPRTQLNEATRLRSEHPRKELPEFTKPTTDTPEPTSVDKHKQWSLEGRTLAIAKAYLRGKLKSSAKTDPSGTL
ncbi:MAG: S1/P1 nuclease, partial [Limisphaerales bacterium]